MIKIPEDIVKIAGWPRQSQTNFRLYVKIDSSTGMLDVTLFIDRWLSNGVNAKVELKVNSLERNICSKGIADDLVPRQLPPGYDQEIGQFQTPEDICFEAEVAALVKGLELRKLPSKAVPAFKKRKGIWRALAKIQFAGSEELKREFDSDEIEGNLFGTIFSSYAGVTGYQTALA